MKDSQPDWGAEAETTNYSRNHEARERLRAKYRHFGWEQIGDLISQKMRENQRLRKKWCKGQEKCSEKKSQIHELQQQVDIVGLSAAAKKKLTTRLARSVASSAKIIEELLNTERMGIALEAETKELREVWEQKWDESQ